jgi:hypothetical protein
LKSFSLTDRLFKETQILPLAEHGSPGDQFMDGLKLLAAVKIINDRPGRKAQQILHDILLSDNTTVTARKQHYFGDFRE